jgi:enoyl-CoA hydratase
MTDYQDWLITEKGHIVTLTLNRPDSGNVITNSTLFELRDISAHLRKRNDVWVVILQGQGEHFSTGIDLSMISERLDDSVEDVRVYLLNQQDCLDEFAALEKPIIAKLRGFCVGGGLLLALCCDIRIASKRTILHLPEVRLGLPILWGTQRIARLVGEGTTKELVMLGKRFKADDALRHGLIHKVVSPEELDSAVSSMADNFLKLPPRTVGAAKRIINGSYGVSMRECQNLELDAVAELLSSPDAHEAIESFLEKRRPQFTGD